MRTCAFLFLVAATLLGTFLFCPQTAFAQDKARQVKSVFLFKFFDYVTWPSGYVPGVSGEAVLCTLGSHDFGNMLEYIADRKSSDFRFRVKSINNISESKACNILFVNSGKYADIRALQENSGVLIVGDKHNILESGGVIQMKEDGGKIGLIVDLQHARKQNLKISSRLLDIAEVRK